MNRVAELHAIKERQEGRTITQRELAEEIGIPLVTLGRWHRNEVKRIDEHIVLRMTEYFNVAVGDLLIVQGESESAPSDEPGNAKTPLRQPAQAA